MSSYFGSSEEAMQIVKAMGLRDARIRELEHALNAAIGHIEILMGSDADESEDVEWLQSILNNEEINK
jgi:hypothetical protein